MRVLEGLAVGAIRAYQWTLRPILPISCRFWPSCSEYAIEAVRRHGLLRGGVLGGWRLLRCHPWGGSGVDPVPARFHLPKSPRDACATDCGVAHRDPI